MQATSLSERLTDWHTDLSVDSVARLVKNVALTGRDSRNGYQYAESALRAALPLYDQKPVFLDHAADRARPHERSTRDLVGTIVNPRFDAGRIRGDIRVLDTDSGRTFLALLTSNAPGVGMSHVVLARRSTDGTTVESIEDVVSVDAVINPATTNTFRESANTPIDEPTRLPTDAQLNPAEGAEMADSTVTAADPGEADSRFLALSTEITALRSQLAELKQEREQEVHAQRMDALLAQSRLPSYALTPQFRQLLAEAASDQSRTDLIRERRDLLNRATRHLPCSLHRRSRDAPSASNAAFLAAIRRK